MNKNNLPRLLVCKDFVDSLNKASELAGGNKNMWNLIKDKKLSDCIHTLAPNGIRFIHFDDKNIENAYEEAKEIEKMIDLDAELFIKKEEEKDIEVSNEELSLGLDYKE